MNGYVQAAQARFFRWNSPAFPDRKNSRTAVPPVRLAGSGLFTGRAGDVRGNAKPKSIQQTARKIHGKSSKPLQKDGRNTTRQAEPDIVRPGRKRLVQPGGPGSFFRFAASLWRTACRYRVKKVFKNHCDLSFLNNRSVNAILCGERPFFCTALTCLFSTLLQNNVAKRYKSERKTSP